MDINACLADALPKHNRLTDSVLAIVTNLLQYNNIEFLSVTGRTRTYKSIVEKIEKKNYKNPTSELTDISGIRIILFVESDIESVSNIISSSFNVDLKNSTNKDRNLLANQVGYRSVHYVCDLGSDRAELPEFKGLGGLKFEFQIRTVLQHAWAELAHDRSYKFGTTLPDKLQRSLYLHAGLLEIADKGFSEIARGIDAYAAELNKRYEAGDLNFPIDTISLSEFIERWARDNNYSIKEISDANTDLDEIIGELNGFSIKTIDKLEEIIPPDYANVSRELGIRTTIYGLVRDWMIIRDVDKLIDLEVDWTLPGPSYNPKYFELYEKLSSPENFERILRNSNDDLVFDEDDGID